MAKARVVLPVSVVLVDGYGEEKCDVEVRLPEPGMPEMATRYREPGGSFEALSVGVC
jgi:hypothetical protein